MADRVRRRPSNADWRAFSTVETVNEGALLHADRKLRESLTDAYRILVALAAVESEVTESLDEARRVVRDGDREETEAERLAEACYCCRPTVASAVATAGLLTPIAVARRFDRIAARPRRWDEVLSEPAMAVEYEEQSVREWVEQLLDLADRLDGYTRGIDDSKHRLFDVERRLSTYVASDRPVERVAATSLSALSAASGTDDVPRSSPSATGTGSAVGLAPSFTDRGGPVDVNIAGGEARGPGRGRRGTNPFTRRTT